MNIKVFNVSLVEELIPGYKSKFENLSNILPEALRNLKTKDVNIAFISEEDIEQLNKEHRKREEVTDVLSFELDNNSGEVYVAPGYILRDFTDLDAFEEVLRVIIHGILHLEGYEHAQKFNDKTKASEEMYIIQEEILNKVLKELKK